MRPHDRKRRLKRHHAKLQQQQEENARANEAGEQHGTEKAHDEMPTKGGNKR